MKTVFGTVLYKEGLSFKNQFIESINRQISKYDFDLIILNDNLSEKELNSITRSVNSEPIVLDYVETNKTPQQLRVELIKETRKLNYNLLILGDFDDKWSSNRIEEYVKCFDSNFAFFYNDLYWNDDTLFFDETPKKVESIHSVLEFNFLGLSTTAINLTFINNFILKELNKCPHFAFDWYLYSLLLICNGKGKKVPDAKTYYGIHANNFAGQSDKTIESLKKELSLKIKHYSALKNLSEIFKNKLDFYTRLENCFMDNYSKLIKCIDLNNDYWWGKIKENDIKRCEKMEINNFEIKNSKKPYIIAEIGANHNGDMDLAKKMIDEAVECGVHAVKFQSWNNESLISREEYDNNQVYNDSSKKHFGSLRQMVEEYYLREEEHVLLKNYCDFKGVVFCSTPFSEREVDLLEEIDVPFYKVASMDINNYRLLDYIGKKNKPVILSTGMATLSEIENAVKTVENTGNNNIALLHCISVYPPDAKDIHLNNIKMLQQLYPDYPVGFSDHSIGTSVPLASVALGASIIEKHFTTDKDLPGWDHEVSADPDEMKEIVSQSEVVSKALGNYYRTVSEAEEVKKEKFRRSIVLTRDMEKGEIIKEQDITFKRPGTHLRPDEQDYVVGRELNQSMKNDDLLNWSDLV